MSSLQRPAAVHSSPSHRSETSEDAHQKVLAVFKNTEQMQVTVRRSLSGDVVCDYTKEGETKRNIILLVAPNYKGQTLIHGKIKYYPNLSAFVFCDSPLHYPREKLSPYSYGFPPLLGNSTNISAARPEVTYLLNSKLENPQFSLKPEESLAVFMECLTRGEVAAEKARTAEEVVVVMGNTGAGKSTFVNYLCGCTLERISAKQLGINSLSPTVITVKPVERGGACCEAVPIRHTSISRTFTPEVVTTSKKITLCDCPGFLQERGFEISVAGAMNIKRVFQAAPSVKVIILVRLKMLMADRAQRLKDLLSICSGIFGSPQNLLQCQASILLGVTHIPSPYLDENGLKEPVEPLQNIKNILKANNAFPLPESQVLSCLAERLFIYDPLNKTSLKYEGALQRDAILEQISQLSCIKAPGVFYQTSLTDEDKEGLSRFYDMLQVKIQALTQCVELAEEHYKELGNLQASLNRLQIVEHPFVSKLQEGIRSILVERLRETVHAFNLLCYQENPENFKKAQIALKKIWEGMRYFDDKTKKCVAKLFNEIPQNTSTASQPALLMREHALANAKHNARLNDLIFASNLEVQKLEGQLAINLRQFSARSEELSQSLQCLSQSIQKDLEEGRLSGERLEMAYMIFDLKNRALEAIIYTSQQLVELEKQGVDAFGQQLKGTLEVALYARLMEINFIQEKLATVEKTMDHEWAITLKVHSHKLAHEIQMYNQALQIKQLVQKEKSNEFNRRIEGIEQGQQELQAQEALRLKEEQIYHKHQMQMYHLQMQGTREMYTLDTMARVELAELLKKLNATNSLN